MKAQGASLSLPVHLGCKSRAVHVVASLITEIENLTGQMFEACMQEAPGLDPALCDELLRLQASLLRLQWWHAMHGKLISDWGAVGLQQVLFQVLWCWQCNHFYSSRGCAGLSCSQGRCSSC